MTPVKAIRVEVGIIFKKNYHATFCYCSKSFSICVPDWPVGGVGVDWGHWAVGGLLAVAMDRRRAIVTVRRKSTSV